MVELFASSEFLKGIRNHILNALHDIGVGSWFAIEVCVYVHLLALIVILYIQGHLGFDFLVHHFTELLDVLTMERVFLIADLLPDARLFGLILFVDVKIGHIHSSCGYLPIKEERWQRFIVLIDYSWRQSLFPQALTDLVRSG